MLPRNRGRGGSILLIASSKLAVAVGSAVVEHVGAWGALWIALYANAAHVGLHTSAHEAVHFGTPAGMLSEVQCMLSCVTSVQHSLARPETTFHTAT